MNLDECIEKRLLSKTDPDLRKAKKSISASERKIQLAKAELKSELYESCFLSAYSAMFHAARAILFKDGFKEKSHYAIYIFLSEKYSGKIEEKYFNEFNNLRIGRHNLMYGLDEPQETSELEAIETIKLVECFIKISKEEINKKQNL